MDEFIPSIKKKYRDRLVNREKQWPPCQSNKLIRLKLVQREKGMGYFAEFQRGQEDKTINKRTPLAYEDLFKVEAGKKLVRKVLVEGDAGIGKTTLSTSIAEDWACDNLFQQFELLLLLPLRHKKLASAGSLTELLNLLHPSSALCESVASYMEKEEGQKVLIIADGWDELSECNQREESFLYQILFEKFPLMSVVITSRPSYCTPLHMLPYIDRFIDIDGFSKEDIKEYIKSEFVGDWEKAYRLLEQLESNPLIESVCSVPLNCTIISHLWRTLEETLPSTMSELYKQIILNVILRNLWKNDTFKTVIHLPHFNALPKELQQPFWQLCEFAFQSLAKYQIVFSRAELVDFFPQGLAINEKILCFGLLQSAEIVLGTGLGMSFHFLHLTFMEYLAALYLTRLPQCSLIELLISHSQQTNSNRFTMVWRFFFGIRFHGCKVEIKDVKPVTQCIASCFYKEELSLCHFAFEAQNAPLSSEIVNIICNNPFHAISFGSPCTAHDCTAVIYAIAHMKDCSHNMIINLSDSSITENQIRILSDVLASKQGKLRVKALYLIGNKLSGTCVSYLLHRASGSFQCLKELALRGNRIGADNIKSIFEIDMFRLSHIDLSHNPLEIAGLQALESAIRDNLLPALELLYLEGSLTSDADTNAAWLTTFVEALCTHCSHLFGLSLSYNNLGVAGASALARVLSQHCMQYRSSSFRQQPQFFTSIFLAKTNIGDNGLSAFTKRLTGVYTLELSRNGIEAPGVLCLADNVCSGKIAIEGGINLSNNTLGLQGSIAVCRMLSSSHCKPEKVTLSGCKLTSTIGCNNPSTHSDSLNLSDMHHVAGSNVGQQLCQLPQNSNITCLDLSNTCFTGDGIHILAGFMHLCCCLIQLDSSDCEITSEDFIMLLNKLTQLKRSSPSLCRKLELWIIRNNKIDDSGICTLIDHLSLLFPHLGCGSMGGIYAYLHNNPVNRGVAIRLKEELKRRRRMMTSSPAYIPATSQTYHPLKSHPPMVEDHEQGHTATCEDLVSFHLLQDDKKVKNRSSTLSVDDLASVQRAAWEGRARWYNLGLELGLSPGTLDAIKLANQCDPDKCFTSVLKEWLKQPELHPSWNGLARSLKASPVGLGHLAEQLLSNHCGSSN